MTAKKNAGKGLPLPDYAYAHVEHYGAPATYCNEDTVCWPSDSFVFLKPTLWLVQKGRKRASFTNLKAAKAFAGKTGKVRAFVEVQA